MRALGTLPLERHRVDLLNSFVLPVVPLAEHRVRPSLVLTAVSLPFASRICPRPARLQAANRAPAAPARQATPSPPRGRSRTRGRIPPSPPSRFRDALAGTTPWTRSLRQTRANGPREAFERRLAMRGTGESIAIAASNVASFKAGNTLREAVAQTERGTLQAQSTNELGDRFTRHGPEHALKVKAREGSFGCQLLYRTRSVNSAHDEVEGLPQSSMAGLGGGGVLLR